MKQVLIVDESPLFRDYLRLKLEENGVEAGAAINAMDGISKMRIMIPDLIIADYHLQRQGFTELLKQKKANPNTVNTPVIVMAQKIEQKQLIELIPFNVKKIFNKPIKIDALYAALAEILGISFTVDDTPGIVEVHVNDSIIFVEIAQGLNRDKLDILRYKIAELINLYEIRVPKVIIMLSDIKLGFSDSPNMQKLFNTIMEVSRAKPRYIRVLTMDDFVRQFILGQKEYSGIKVVNNLQLAIDDLLADIGKGVDEEDKKAEIIGDRILRAKTTEEGGSMILKFDVEEKSAGTESMKDPVQNTRIAVIGGDIEIRETIKNTFKKFGAFVDVFSDGGEFLDIVDSGQYDLVFLDLDMPGADGFGLLAAIQAKNLKCPVIILSSIVRRETMIKAVQMGVKSYLVKPLKPDDIYKKSAEILKANF